MAVAPEPLPLVVTDHLSEARNRAREMLSTEAHLGDVDDWRRALVSGRDAIIVIWMVWLAMHGLNDPPFTGPLLAAVSIGLALLLGISTARSTYMQVQFYAEELERERREIRDSFPQEREEIRALYAAKGFSGTLLEQIVDTLCADDDRLLKIMMEEELGLNLHHVHHPLMVGIWNFGGALAPGLLLTLPLLWLSTAAAHGWMPIAAAFLLLIVSVVSALATKRNTLGCFAVAVIMAGVTGGVAYFLAQWLGTLAPVGSTG